MPKEAHGLVHYDLHPANFLIDGEHIRVFDFADCAYVMFALDIGCALTVGLWLGRYNNKAHDFALDMLRYFIKGYLAANPLSDFWLYRILLFMKLCQISGFSCTCNRVDLDKQTQQAQIADLMSDTVAPG